jgi:hypothetical protein
MGAEVLNINGQDGATSPASAAPYGQSEEARSFVAEMLEKCQFEDPASRQMLDRMGELIDEMAECRAIIRANGGPFMKDRFGKPKKHPAADHQLGLLNEFGKIYRLLGLDQAPQEQGKLDF